jgi:hypothetical protein
VKGDILLDDGRTTCAPRLASASRPGFFCVRSQKARVGEVVGEEWVKSGGMGG